MKRAIGLRVGVAMSIAAAVACGRENAAEERPVAGAAAHIDSAAGDVAQYSLMREPVSWLTDSNLVALATIVNQPAIQLARIESQEFTDQATHEFALEVLRDHVALQASLDSLAGKRRIPSQRPAVAQSMQAPYDSTVATLVGTPVQQMEQRFLAAEREVHARTLVDFGALAGNATDPDLRSLLSAKAIAMERHHVARADQVAGSLARADSAKQEARSTRKP